MYGGSVFNCVFPMEHTNHWSPRGPIDLCMLPKEHTYRLGLQRPNRYAKNAGRAILKLRALRLLLTEPAKLQ